MRIRNKKFEDHERIIAIAESLPRWFTKGGVDFIRQDLNFQLGLVAEIESEIVGFLTYFGNQSVVTIGWMGLSPSYRRSGIGTRLLEQLKSEMRQHKLQTIHVSTLGDSVDYEPYRQTRAFYRKNGFQDFKILQHPDNPEQEEELILQLQF